MNGHSIIDSVIDILQGVFIVVFQLKSISQDMICAHTSMGRLQMYLYPFSFLDQLLISNCMVLIIL
jgi:hypothetical protein